MNISLDGNAPSFEETAKWNSQMEQDCDSLRSHATPRVQLTGHPVYGGNISLRTQLMNQFNSVETFLKLRMSLMRKT